MRVAVCGAGHWHVPMYLQALVSAGAEIVALQDEDPEAVERAREIVDAPGFSDLRAMLDQAKPDFVFAHATHDKMTDVAAALVDAGVPFHMEKPMGLDWRKLAIVAEKAREKGLFISVPLVTRMFGVIARLRELKGEGRLGQPAHLYFRLYAGSPYRYLEYRVPWMLNPEIAGGGPLFNFGPHAIDLAIIFGGLPRFVFATASHGVYGLKIEDWICITCVHDGQMRSVLEVSYTRPADYEREFVLSTDRLFFSGLVHEGEIVWREGGTEKVGVSVSVEEVYARYTAEVLKRYASGQPPLASIDDMVQILRIINAAQKSLQTSQAVEP